MAAVVSPNQPPGAADLDLAAVRAFLAVSAHRHFGRAALSLSVAASTVTKRVLRLESDLGAVLLERDSGGVIGLTDAGHRFLPIATDLIHSAHEARRAAQGRPSLTLRLAVPSGAQIAAPLMGTELDSLESVLSLAHPGVALTLSATRFDAISEDLLADRIDVALLVGEPTDPRLAAAKLGDVHRTGLVGPTHPFALRGAVDAREFADQPMLQPVGLDQPYMTAFLLADIRPLAEANLVPVAATSAAQIVQRLMTGREVTVVPAALTANLPRGIARITLLGTPECCYVAVHRRDDLRPELHTMIDLMTGFTDTISRNVLD